MTPTSSHIQSQPSNQKPRQGHFQVYYFAAASSYTQKSAETFPAPLPLSQLFHVLETKYPGIREKVLSSCGVSLGMDYVDVEGTDGGGENSVVIKDGDEVGIIPPVSSG